MPELNDSTDLVVRNLVAKHFGITRAAAGARVYVLSLETRARLAEIAARLNADEPGEADRFVQLFEAAEREAAGEVANPEAPIPTAAEAALEPPAGELPEDQDDPLASTAAEPSSELAGE